MAKESRSFSAEEPFCAAKDEPPPYSEKLDYLGNAAGPPEYGSVATQPYPAVQQQYGYGVTQGYNPAPLTMQPPIHQVRSGRVNWKSVYVFISGRQHHDSRKIIT